MRNWLLWMAILSGAARAQTADEVRAATKAFLVEWAQSQKAGDSARYLAMYDAKRFKGTKRTTSGERKEYDFAAWAADRKKMLKNKPEVGVDNVVISTWVEDDRKPGMIYVTFTQRWRSAHYADHGPKIMQLYWNAGKLQIESEALLQSQPGWDKPTGITVDMPVPRTDEEAAARWAKIAPTGKDWEQRLETIPNVPQLRRALAKSILAGDLDCQNLTDEGQCGIEDWRWGPIDKDAGLDDPCLRRKVALWILPSATLNESILKVFAYKRPKSKAAGEGDGDELCKAVLDGTSGDLQIKAIDAALDKQCGEAQARDLIGRLPEAEQLQYAEQDIEEGFGNVPAKKHVDVYRAAMKGGGSTAHRLEMMQALKDAGIHSDVFKEDLRTIADQDTNLEVSAQAGVTLAKLGDGSRLPQRREADLERQFMRLGYDKDHRDAKLRAFLPPGKKGKFSSETAIEREYDGNTPPEDRQEHEEHTTKLKYEDVSWELLEAFIHPKENHEVKLVWKEIAGKTYLVGMTDTETKFIGCGC